MKLEVLGPVFSVCKARDLSGVDFSAEYCFVGKTDAELSLVCPRSAAPADALAREDGWRAFRVAGTLDFSLTGVLLIVGAFLYIRFKERFEAHG